MPEIWFVRASSGGALIPEYLSRGVMAIGLRGTSDFRNFDTREAVRDHIMSTPKRGEIGNKTYGSGSVRYGCQFFYDVAINDPVLLMKGADQVVAVGRVSGEYEFLEEPRWGHGQPNYCHMRSVEWTKLPSQIAVKGVPRVAGFGRVSEGKASAVLDCITDHINEDRQGTVGLDILQEVDYSNGK